MPTRKPAPVIISNDQQEIKIYTTESHGRPLHQLSYYRGGKRERRSFADLNEAKREARIILGQMARDSIQGGNLTAAEIESYTVARRVLAPLNVPVHVAVERYAATHRELPDGVTTLDAVRYWKRYNLGIKQRTISDLLEEYIAAKDATRVSNGYLYVIRRFVGGFGNFTSGRVLSSLRCQDLDDWLKALSWGPTRKNDALQKIITFTKWAKERGYALREAVERMDVAVIHRLAQKAIGTAERIKREQLAAATPGLRERHEDIVIHDDAERGKVVVQFPERLDERMRRVLKIYGFCGSGDGATYWRKRTFRRGENMALDTARDVVERLLEDRAKLAASEQAAFERANPRPVDRAKQRDIEGGWL